MSCFQSGLAVSPQSTEMEMLSLKRGTGKKPEVQMASSFEKFGY